MSSDDRRTEERRATPGPDRELWTAEGREIARCVVDEIDRRLLGEGVTPVDHKRHHEFLMKNREIVAAMVRYYERRAQLIERLSSDVVIEGVKWLFVFIGMAILFGTIPALRQMLW